jgi:hypothetical protein
MMSKKWIAVIAVSLLLVVAVTTTVLAQGTTPATPTTPVPKTMPFMKGWGMMGRGWTDFDAMAKALNLTPTQLFEQLHSGKTLEEIATAQGVDLQKVQDAAQAARLEAMKQAIQDAVKAGTITQDQADWMLKGLENGWGFGFGRGFGRGFGHGFGPGFFVPKSNGGTWAPVVPQGAQQG